MCFGDRIETRWERTRVSGGQGSKRGKKVSFEAGEGASVG